MTKAAQEKRQNLEFGNIIIIDKIRSINSTEKKEAEEA